ncbi:MAG: hypothetical protein QNJ38_01640 [Prochloraceae cyanobacterium]|nr:hypothetical protein [Prochloraceae cyanobacterium]
MKENINRPELESCDEQNSLNLWDYKPWWCQPWSIILTGILAILATFVVTKIVWLRLLVFATILAWWTYFLVLIPKMFENSAFKVQRSQLLDNYAIREQNQSRSDY